MDLHFVLKKGFRTFFCCLVYITYLIDRLMLSQPLFKFVAPLSFKIRRTKAVTHMFSKGLTG